MLSSMTAYMSFFSFSQRWSSGVAITWHGASVPSGILSRVRISCGVAFVGGPHPRSFKFGLPGPQCLCAMKNAFLGVIAGAGLEPARVVSSLRFERSASTCFFAIPLSNPSVACHRNQEGDDCQYQSHEVDRTH